MRRNKGGGLRSPQLRRKRQISGDERGSWEISCSAGAVVFPARWSVGSSQAEGQLSEAQFQNSRWSLSSFATPKKFCCDDLVDKCRSFEVIYVTKEGQCPIHPLADGLTLGPLCDKCHISVFLDIPGVMSGDGVSEVQRGN